MAPQLRGKAGKMIAVPRRTKPHVGAARNDKGLGLPLDALATNLLNADGVGGAGAALAYDTTASATLSSWKPVERSSR